MHNPRFDFPIFRSSHTPPLVYLDNAASTQTPETVIDAMTSYYRNGHANVHRGVYRLSEEATSQFQHARDAVRDFIHASSSREIVFVRGTTEAVNLVAQTFLKPRLQPNDVVIATEMEHHSNLLPWQAVCRETGAKLHILPVSDTGELKSEALESALNKGHCKFLAVTHVSNVFGTVNPISELIRLAHQADVPVLVDGAQAVAHMTVDVQNIDCDFYAFSGHKMYAPTGIGVLYGKTEWLQSMPPYHQGGGMVRNVSLQEAAFREIPYRFEAGTPNVVGAVGLATAIRYLQQLDRIELQEKETRLVQMVVEQLKQYPSIRTWTPTQGHIAVVSFVIDGIHPHDIASILDQEGIAVRAGHHCAMPLMQRFQVPGTVRASFGCYNDVSDADALIAGIRTVFNIFE